MSTINKAVEHYHLLIDELAKNADQNFGAIGDPFFEGARLYTCDRIEGCFNYEKMAELGTKKLNEIERLLMQTKETWSLFVPILTKLKSIAPEFNKNRKFVFLASWGMGPAEIGWCIRYLNDRSMFEGYLAASGISEADVDLYNDAFAEELRQANIC